MIGCVKAEFKKLKKECAAHAPIGTRHGGHALATQPHARATLNANAKCAHGRRHHAAGKTRQTPLDFMEKKGTKKRKLGKLALSFGNRETCAKPARNLRETCA